MLFDLVNVGKLEVRKRRFFLPFLHSPILYPSEPTNKKKIKKLITDKTHKTAKSFLFSLEREGERERGRIGFIARAKIDRHHVKFLIEHQIRKKQREIRKGSSLPLKESKKLCTTVQAYPEP